MRRDKELVFDGIHYKIIYNADFVAFPFMLVDKNNDRRIASYATEQAARAAVEYHDNRFRGLHVQ